MRCLLPLLLLAVVLLSGCPPNMARRPTPPEATGLPLPTDHDWRDIHVGKLVGVGGFGEFLELEFADAAYKVPFGEFKDSDPWHVGDQVALQDKEETIGGGLAARITYHGYRFRAVKFQDPGKPSLPAEKEPVK